MNCNFQPEMNKNFSLAGHRISISAFFFLHGVCFASWASRIPSIQQNLHLNETSLGAVLFALPVGSFLTVPLSGLLVARRGSRDLVWITALIYSAILSCIGFAGATWQLVIALFLFGSSGNMCNIAFNTQALGLEKLYGRRIMSSFHGVWSVAGLAGAGFGGWVMGTGMPVWIHFLIITGLSFLIVFFCRQQLLAEDKQEGGRRTAFTRPEGILVILGMIAFCSMMCQGAMFDWTGVYFKKVLHAIPAWIGAGYTAYMLSMAATRFLADWISHHIGLRNTLFWSGVLTAGGLVLMVLIPNIPASIVGSTLVGIGVSPVVPLVYSAVAQSKVMAAPLAIAAVSTMGFIGLLIGPPLVGFVAGWAGLPVSFIVLAAIGLTVSILSFKVNYEIKPQDEISSTASNIASEI
ncbi:MAG: MFS transporter [Bacteroidetes bacterium]|nr:MAG: MFS transporter [Bacteroidota bacterium]